MDMVFNNAAQLAMLAAWIDTGGLLDGAKMKLFKNNYVPIETSLIANFTLCDFTGYAAEVITWGDPSVSDDGTPEVIGSLAEFRPTGTAVANDVYGAILTMGDDTYLAGAQLDDAPEVMQDTLNQLSLVARVRVSPLGIPCVQIT